MPTKERPILFSVTTGQPPRSRDLSDEDMDQIAAWVGEHAHGDIGYHALADRIIRLCSTAAQPPAGWREALEFYAERRHFGLSDESAWDTVSGEPQNFWCDEAGTATIEDGSIAKLALSGHAIRFEDEDTIAPSEQAPAQAAPAAVGQPAMTPAHQRALENVALLADILNRRPAMNAGLSEAYAYWTAEVYNLMGAMAAEPANDAAAPKAAPAAAAGPVKLPFAIMDDELEALRRFDECARDFEAGGHDVRKEMMKRLAEIGLVRRVTANIYEHTTFGLSVLGGYFDAAPTTKAAPQPAAQQGDAEDAARLDWLGNQFVTVRVPLRYGSKECFLGSPDDNDGESVPWDIRGAIDAARSAKEGAQQSAPKAVQQFGAGDAVFAFASMLTALPRVVPFGSAAWATPGVELATAFNAANGLSVSLDFPSGIVFPKVDGDLLAVIEKAAALQPAVHQGKPVAWRSWDSENSRWNLTLWPDEWVGHADVWEPLYTNPAAPAAQGDALPREDFAWMVVQEACETEPADEDDPECIRILRRDLKSAVLAAFLREAAARAAKEGDRNG